MNSNNIKWWGISILGISFLGFFFGGALPIPLMGKFFLGAFGFGTGVVFLIVSNILRIREYESPENAGAPEEQENQANEEDEE